MKYLMLIYGNQEKWASIPADEWPEAIAKQGAFNRKYQATGELIGAYGLADDLRAKLVRRENGQPAVTDGPYLETKEYIASFYLLDCESEERALQIAADMPWADVHEGPLADVVRTGAVRQPGGDLGRPVEAVAVDEPVPGQDLLGFGVRAVGHHRARVPQPDPAGVDRGGQALRVHQFPGFGQVLAERLHELAHRRELGRGPGRLAARRVARHPVVVLLGSVHQDDVFHDSSLGAVPCYWIIRGAFTGDVGAAGPDRTPAAREV